MRSISIVLVSASSEYASVGDRADEIVGYLRSHGASFFAAIHQGISLAIYVLVALMWLVPDRRIEKQMTPS